jgi:HK97 family phage portal protein
MAELTIIGALRNAAGSKKALTPISDWRHGWRVIGEPYTGAWQKNDELKVCDITTYGTLYACLAAISQDIGKLPFLLMRKEGEYFKEVENPAYSPVLRKPNGYQNPGQFRVAWILSLLLDGNTFVLKQRDNRGVVTALYVLDPCRVTPMVSEFGNVFYQINYPSPNNLLPEGYPGAQLTIPASEIIHDRINPLFHHLIGIPPVTAAALAAGKNLKILRNSSKFFDNGANPGGLISGPASMDEEDGKTLTEYFNTNFQGDNSGKIAFVGADLKFSPFGFKAADSQLVEQMKYSDEQICQPFRIKPYKIGIGNPPGGWKSDDVNVEYHSDALSPLIENMENLLMEGLGVSMPLQIWLDSEPLWRMDEGKLADVQTKLVQGMVSKPNEARKKFNAPPTDGGDTLWGQHQDYPLGMLANRTDLSPTAPEPEADPALDEQAEEVRQLKAELWQRKAIEATREAIHA